MTFTHKLQKFIALFGPQQLQASVLLPGGVFLGMSLLLLGCFLLGSFMLAGTGLSPMGGLMGAMFLGLVMPCLLIAEGLGFILYLGHQWRTIALLQATHAEDFLPWTREECHSSFMVGLHLAGYSILILFGFQLLSHAMEHMTGYQAQAALIDAPVIGDFQSITYQETSDAQYFDLFMRMFQSVLVELMLFTLLLPFILAPVFYNAGQPNIWAMLKTIVPSWRWMLKRYPHILGLTTCGFSMILIGVGISCLLLSLTLVGVVLIPFILAASTYLMNVLLTRAYPSPYVMAVEAIPVTENNIKNI